MGVIKRFAIGSMVLGLLAMACGASALAFDGGSGQVAGVQKVEEPTRFSEASNDLTSDVASDVLPETGASPSDSAAYRWLKPHGG